MLAPNTQNYMYGKGHMLFKKTGDSGFLHLGNCPDFGINVEVAKEDHYSAMSGTKEKDATRVTEKNAKSTISLEEISPENIDLAFLGDGVQTAAQSAGNLDAVQTTTVADRFVELNALGIYHTKLSHGTVTGGPFEAGETVTGATSGATAEVAWPAANHLELINVVGSFQAGETIDGGTSLASATVAGTEKVNDAVVTDAATPATRYTLGTDYTIQADGGLLRELSGGSIAANTCYVSAQYGAKSLKSVNALVNSSVEGQLLFIGTPDDGPKKKVEGWKVSLTITGEVKYISEGIATIPLEAEYLSDATNHPSNPFFKETTIE